MKIAHFTCGTVLLSYVDYTDIILFLKAVSIQFYPINDHALIFVTTDHL